MVDSLTNTIRTYLYGPRYNIALPIHTAFKMIDYMRGVALHIYKVSRMVQ